MSKTNKTPLRILYGALLLVIIAIGLLIAFKPEKKAPPSAKEKAQEVMAIPVTLTNTADIVYLPAMIAANVNATLSAEKPGRIVELNADRGDHVTKGQLLLQLDDRIWQADLKNAEIAKRDALSNFERFKTLKETGAVAPSQYEEIERQHINAESMLETANINIEQCRVLSPIDGVINDRFVEVGEYVQPGTPVFQVIDHATVNVRLQVPERDIFALEMDETVTFTIQPFPDRTFEGKVTFIAAQADSRNNAFRAEITADNAEGALRPGMIAQVAFHRGVRAGMVSLPIAAVLPSKGDHIVYLIKNDHATRRKVQIEKMTGDQVLIYSGLEAGELVILEGNRTLSDGQLVKQVETEAK